MAEKLLISLQDIRDYRPVSDMSVERVMPYIRETQLNDLRPFVGDAMYYDLITNTTTVNNQRLLNGMTYVDPSTNTNVDFYGINPMLVYFTLARIVTNNQINITSFGITVKTVQQSAPASDQQIKMLVTELRSIAVTYQQAAEKYLNDNKTTYTLWKGTNIDVNTGFNFFKM